MTNQTLVMESQTKCVEFKSQPGPFPLEAYAACLSEESQFYYTIVFLLVPMMFYLTEFLTLRTEYEPTGLRQRIKGILDKLKDNEKMWPERIVIGIIVYTYIGNKNNIPKLMRIPYYLSRY
jgi:hypothetical protein